jgi:hypothetical protein
VRKFEVAKREYFENSIEGDLTQANNDFGLDDLYFTLQIRLAIIHSWDSVYYQAERSDPTR